MLTSGNITINPRSPSQHAADISIDEILDLKTGELLDSKKFIKSFVHEDIIRLRHELRASWVENPKYACPICLVSVSLVATMQKKWFFRHLKEDGSCPSVTKSSLTADEIKARKYHGLKESEAHKLFKSLMQQSLEADTSFSDVKPEAYVKATTSKKAMRRPDVQAKRDGQLLAFEIQLSTTFLDVVIARKAFYRDESARLIWVLPSVDPNDRRLMDDDVIFNNNNNFFVVNSETTQKSVETRQLHMLCWYREPFWNKGAIDAEWKSKLVSFDELAWEQDNQRLYWFDYDGAVADIQADEAEKEASLKASQMEAKAVQLRLEREAIEKDDNDLRADFENFWCGRNHNSWSAAASVVWQDLRQRFASRNLILPEYPSNEPTMPSFLSAIYSAKTGKSVSWGFANILEVAHNLAVNHKMHLLAFGYAVKIYGNGELMEKLDQSRKWAAKKIEINKLILKRHHDYFPDQDLQPLTKFLFPELHEKLERFIDNTYE